MPFRDEKARRIVQAVLANIQAWEDRVLEIEANANPGNKVRALALARDLEQARVSLTRLAGHDARQNPPDPGHPSEVAGPVD